MKYLTLLLERRPGGQTIGATPISETQPLRKMPCQEDDHDHLLSVLGFMVLREMCNRHCYSVRRRQLVVETDRQPRLVNGDNLVGRPSPQACVTEALGDTKKAVERWQSLDNVNKSSELDVALYSAVLDTIEGMTRCDRSSSDCRDDSPPEENASYGGSKQELLVSLFGDGYTLSCCGRYILTQRCKPSEATHPSPLLSYKDTRNFDILKQIRDGYKPIGLKATLSESNVNRVVVEDRLPSTFAEYLARKRIEARSPMTSSAPSQTAYDPAFVRRKRLARFSHNISPARDTPSKKQRAVRPACAAPVTNPNSVRRLA